MGIRRRNVHVEGDDITQGSSTGTPKRNHVVKKIQTWQWMVAKVLTLSLLLPLLLLMLYHPRCTNTCTLNDTDTMFSCDIAAAIDDSQHKRPTINFIASAVGEKYEDILPLYIFYALNAHRSVGGGGAVAEFIVPNRTNFINRHHNSLTWIHNTFSSYNFFCKIKRHAICVREYSADHKNRTKVTNTWRFLEVPARRSAKYTYIGDIDIFLTESVLDPKRMQQMSEFKIPYSNKVRDYNAAIPRLTGLMLMDTDAFYTNALLKAQKAVDASGNDEHFLYKIVIEAGFGVPPSNSSSSLLTYRPEHGIHLSYNRGPGKPMCTVSMKQFQKILVVDGLEDFSRNNTVIYDYLLNWRTMVEEQERENMTVIDNKCQPRNKTLKTLQ